MRNTKKAKFALVIANGPSASGLDEQAVLRMQEQEKLDVFVMNNFCSSELSSRIRPDFYVLSDPKHNWLSEEPLGLSALSYFSSVPGITVFIPRHWVIRRVRLPGEVVAFEDLSLESISSNISPLRPRGYMSLTALKALAISIFLGYERLYVVGLDNNFYLGLRVGRDNRLIQGAHHISGAQSEDVTDVTAHYPNGTADYFYDLALTLNTLRKFARKASIRNLDFDSITDAFVKSDELGLMKCEGN